MVHMRAMDFRLLLLDALGWILGLWRSVQLRVLHVLSVHWDPIDWSRRPLCLQEPRGERAWIVEAGNEPMRRRLRLMFATVETPYPADIAEPYPVMFVVTFASIGHAIRCTVNDVETVTIESRGRSVIFDVGLGGISLERIYEEAYTNL